jgi:amino acid transporter
MELPRKLGLFSTIAVLIGSTIGSGIFRSSAGIAARLPDERLFFATWIFGGFCVLAGALTYAELASALPRTGGVFVYLREAFGRLPAFLFGWAELTIVRASAFGGIATVFAEYLLRMLGVVVSNHDDAVHYIAAASITPYIAIWLAAALGAAFVMVRNFEQLADAFVLGIWPFYAEGAAAVYVLRRNRPDLERPYRVWGYPVTPAIFLGAALFLLGNALVNGSAMLVFAILLLGIPVYWIWNLVKGFIVG